MSDMQDGSFPTIKTDVNIRIVAEMIGRRCYKGEIREALERAMEMEGGSLNGKTLTHLMTKGRELLRSRRDLELADSLDMSIEFYSTIIRDPKKSDQYRIRCQERLDLLLGHEGQAGGLSTADKVQKAIDLLKETQTNDNGEIDFHEPEDAS